MAEASQKLLIESIKGLLASGSYSDLIITCRGDAYNVHKSIVCQRADFFARAISFGGQEAQDSKCDLPDDEPAIVKLMLQYLYQGNYQTPPDIKTSKSPYNIEFPHWCKLSCCQLALCPHHECGYNCNMDCVEFTCTTCAPKDPEASSNLITHSKMYELADKYDIVGLKDLSASKFSLACGIHWDDPHFCVAAHHAFSTTPSTDKGLRDIVSKTIANHMVLLEKPEIETLMSEFNGLAFGLLKEKAKANRWR